VDPSEPKKPLHTRLIERLAASRFFTFSALVHGVLIFLGGSVVLFTHKADPPDFESNGGGLVATDGQAETPPDRPPDVTQKFQPTEPQIDTPAAIISINESKFQIAQSVSAPTAFTNVSNIPSSMSSRVGGAARTSAMTRNGGTKESEEAVVRGLRWLAKNQAPDGSWGAANKGAMTGFGLLSFLGHGETPASTEFGPTVRKAVEWILQNGAKFEGRLSMGKAFNQPGVYEHAIATYALGEYYTMTKDERVVDLFKKAVGYIVDGQSPDGGWVYGYTKEGDGDTSVTGWQIQALKAAHLTGLNIEGVDQALDKSMLDLQRVQGPKGGFGYRGPQDKYSLTGVGVLCTYFWKQTKNESVRNGIEYMMKETETRHPVQYQGETADLYAWYYNTQACLMVGGAAWTKWNSLFQTEITKAQDTDGSWPPMTAKSLGELQSGPTGNGPLYRTNLCILMLEVFYRYMPSTK
jgi:hypothetical protein